MPHLSDLWSEISSERDDVTMLSVNSGDAKDVIANWWREGSFSHQAVRQDGREVASAFDVDVYPTNIVVGPAGRVLYAAAGYDEAAIRKALASTVR